MAVMLFASRCETELKSIGSSSFEANRFGLEARLRHWAVETVNRTRVVTVAQMALAVDQFLVWFAPSEAGLSGGHGNLFYEYMYLQELFGHTAGTTISWRRKC